MVEINWGDFIYGINTIRGKDERAYGKCRQGRYLNELYEEKCEWPR